jgi:IS605 OrfB family transposase
LKDNAISLYTLSGRILVKMNLGEFQQNYLQSGYPKEAELICKGGQWFFNLVLDLPDVQLLPSTGKVLGVDLGENNLAATSSGKLFGGGKLRHERDCALALRRQLQSNGSESARQLLKKISGKEARHVKHVNHVVSKAIVEEAKTTGCDTIAMESLTNIRRRIRAGKRVRSRLHRWSWAQLQEFVQYKAQAIGLNVVFVNPAYTSQMCAECGQIGIRQKHRLVCKFCEVQRHSDLNASQNIRRITISADIVTGTVNCPNVATT